MRIAKLTTLAAMSLVLAACQGTGPRNAMPAPAPASDQMPLQTLPPQRLAPGQCALVLWRKGGGNSRIFMALSEPAMARVRIAGRDIDLTRTDAEGDRAFGLSPRQTYQGGGVALTVDLEIDPDRGLLAGAVVPSGVLDLRREGGTSVILPVGGLIACQPQ